MMSDQTDTPISTAPGDFTLEHDIVVADKVVLAAGTTIHVRKPMGGALRGTNLGGLVRMDYNQVAMVAPRVTAPILMHPADREVWELTHTDHLWDVDLEDGQSVKVAGASITVLHTPGHAPGAVSLYVHDLGCVFTGDTLFEGGPGATGRSFSDEDLIKDSIRTKLFDLPDETVVHTGHGADTTIGAERANLG